MIHNRKKSTKGGLYEFLNETTPIYCGIDLHGKSMYLLDCPIPGVQSNTFLWNNLKKSLKIELLIF
jgi:hypothetical protein